MPNVLLSEINNQKKKNKYMKNLNYKKKEKI